MKQAKQKFDDLASLIGQGEAVSFGQMEEVFAQAFLTKFLAKLSSESQRKRTQEFYQAHMQDEYQDEDEEPRELSEKQQVQYELEIARSVIGALGVRPTTQDLQTYIQYSLKERDWDMLDKVLSLTSDGKLTTGTLEEIAIKELGSYNIDSYKELAAKFPQISIKAEQVIPLYEQWITTGGLLHTKDVREATGIPIPEQLIQKGYETYLSLKYAGAIQLMQKLHEITGTRPQKTPELIEILGSLYQNLTIEKLQQNILDGPILEDEGWEDHRRRGEPKKTGPIQQKELDELDKLLDIYSDPELAIPLQKSAADAGLTELFAHVYGRTQHRLPAEDLKKYYDNLAEHKQFEDIAKLIIQTRTAPDEPTYSKTCSALLGSGTKLEPLKDIVYIAGRKPEFDQDAVNKTAKAYSEYRSMTGLEELAKLGAKIQPEYAYTAARRHITYRSSVYQSYSGLDDRCKEADEFLARFGLKPSCEVTEAKIYALTEQLNNKIFEVEEELTNKDFTLGDIYGIADDSKIDPLTIVPGSMKQHISFKARTRKLLKEYTAQAKNLKKENPGLEIQDRAMIDSLYATCLITALTQTLVGDTRYIKTDKLTQTLGVPVTRRNISIAVYQHVRRNAYNEKNPEGLLEKLSEAGIPIIVDEELFNDIASDLVSNAINPGRKLEYLQKLTGHTEYSPKVKETARSAALRSLIECDITKYQSLESITGKVELTDYEKSRIGEGIISKLRSDPTKHYNAAKTIIEKTGVQPKADHWELSTIIKKYFEPGDFCTHPTQFARMLNQELDTSQVFERTIKLIHTNQIQYAKELYHDTQISPTENGARNILSRYNPDDQRIMRERMIAVYGNIPGLR